MNRLHLSNKSKNSGINITRNPADPASWTTSGITVGTNTSSRLNATLNQSMRDLPAAFMRLKVLEPGP